MGEKNQGKKKSKNPGRGNSISMGQVMGIGMLRAVSILIKNVDVFMKEIYCHHFESYQKLHPQKMFVLWAIVQLLLMMLP